MRSLLIESWPVAGSFALIAGLIFHKSINISFCILSLILIYILLTLIKGFKPLWTVFLTVIILLSFWRGYYFYKADRLFSPGSNCIITAVIDGNAYQDNWATYIPVRLINIDGYSNPRYLGKIKATVCIPENRAYILVDKTISINGIIVFRGEVEMSPNRGYLYDLGLNVQKRLLIRPARIFHYSDSQTLKLLPSVERIFSPLPADARSLIIPLITGKRDYMTCRDRLLIQKSGLFHIFVISGFHIGLFALILFFFFRIFLSRSAIIPIILVILFIYISEIGFPIAALRAYVMLFVFSAAYMLKRKIPGFYGLIFSIYIIIFIFPADLLSLSFIMSLLAVSGIILGLPVVKKMKLRSYIADYTVKSWLISLFAFFFIAPVLISIFGYVSLWGVLVFPFASVLVLLLMISSLFLTVFQASWIAHVIDFISKAFRLFINEDVLSLFLIDKPPGFLTNTSIILIYYSLLLMALYLLTSEKFPLVMLFCVICAGLIFSRQDTSPMIRDTLTEGTVAYFERGLLYKGNLNQNDDAAIDRITGSGSISRLVLVVPVHKRLTSKILSYKRFCDDIFLFIIDKGRHKTDYIYTYTVLRKLKIPYKIIDNSDKCVIYDKTSDK